MWQQQVQFRTLQINSLRGLLNKYGDVMGRSREALDKAMSGILAKLSERLPAALIDTSREQFPKLDR